MKKILAVLTVIALLLSMSAVFAEGTDETIEIGQQIPDFNVTLTVPEGYVSEQYYSDGQMYVFLIAEDEKDSEEQLHTSYVISVAYSEEYDGTTVQSMSDEEKENFIEVMGFEMNNPVFSQTETSHGTAIFFLRESTDDPALDWALGMSVYEGYIVNMYIYPGQGNLLTDDDINLGVEILSEVWFEAVQ